MNEEIKKYCCFDETTDDLSWLFGDDYADSSCNNKFDLSDEHISKAIETLLGNDKMSLINDIINYYDNNRTTFCNSLQFENMLSAYSSYEDFCKEFGFHPLDKSLLDKKSEWPIGFEYEHKNFFQRVHSIFLNIALEVIKKREDYRYNIGDIIRFDKCTESVKVYDNICAFFIHGAWGICDISGKVLVSNNLKDRPSNNGRVYNSWKWYSYNNFLLLQDVNSEKYGVFSIKSEKVIVPLKYDYILLRNEGSQEAKECIFLVNEGGTFSKWREKLIEGGKWGVYNSLGEQIVNAKYDYIQYENNYIECGHDGECKIYEYDDMKFDKFYEGKFDLFNLNGDMLIGGYEFMSMDKGNIVFYFDIKTKVVPRKIELWDGREFYYETFYIPTRDFTDSVSFAVDENFNYILNYGSKRSKLETGIYFENIEEMKSIIPHNQFLHGYVSFDNGFIYQTVDHGDEYVIPNLVTDCNPVLPIPQPSSDGIFRYFNQESWTNTISILVDGQWTDVNTGSWNDIHLDDDIVIIINIDDNGHIKWCERVNEIGKIQYYTHVYRIGDKVGLYDETGIHPTRFNAFCIDKNYVAIYNNTSEDVSSPNYTHLNNSLIEYYKTDPYFENFERMPDYWSKFNPAKLQWFPQAFKDDNGIYMDEFEGYDEPYHDSCEWTDEDAWDAMTDGQYGEYPGSGWDPERFGY